MIIFLIAELLDFNSTIKQPSLCSDEQSLSELNSNTAKEYQVGKAVLQKALSKCVSPTEQSGKSTQELEQYFIESGYNIIIMQV